MKGIAIPGFVIDKKTGKPKRLYRMSVSKKIGQKAKAEREARKWKSKGKTGNRRPGSST